MKKIVFSLVIASFVFNGFSYADVYVVTAPDKTVYSLSEQNDAVIPSGYSLDVIKGKSIRDLALDDVKLYTYSGKKFTLDDKKVVEKNKQLQAESVAREKAIADKASAIAKLKALGLTGDELNALIK